MPDRRRRQSNERRDGRPSRLRDLSRQEEHFENKRPFVTSDAVRSRTALLVLGLREDVEPLSVWAQAFRERGHVVCRLASPDFVGFCESAHVEAAAAFPEEDVVQTALVPLQGLKEDEEQLTFTGMLLLQLLDDAGLALWALLRSAHFTSDHADDVANVAPPRPLLFATSGAVDCASWCLKDEAKAQDVVDYKTQEDLQDFVKDSTGDPYASVPVP